MFNKYNFCNEDKRIELQEKLCKSTSIEGFVYIDFFIAGHAGIVSVYFVSTETKDAFLKTDTYKEFYEAFKDIDVTLNVKVSKAMLHFEKEMEQINNIFKDPHYLRALLGTNTDTNARFELQLRLMQDARFRAIQALIN